MGLLAGLATAFVASIGMLVAFKDRAVVSSLSLDYVILIAIPLSFGYLAGKPPQQLEGFAEAHRGTRNVLAGALAGAIAGGEIGGYLALVGNFNVREQLINVSPEMIGRLTFQQGLLKGWLLIMAGSVGLSALGASFNLLRQRIRGALAYALAWVVVFGLLQVVVSSILNKLGFPFTDRLYDLRGSLSIPGATGVFAAMLGLHLMAKGKRARLRERINELPPRERRFAIIAALVGIVVILAAVPNLLSSNLAEDLNLALIFLLMALGLNLVVGVAGLLDLGYVAFFAVGAYAAAIFMSPLSPKWAPSLTFFEAIPFVILAAALAGFIVGVPVLRMRGDYLAIVTLGFGEIARLLVTSTWLTPYFGGALGIIRIPSVHVGGIEFLGSNPQRFFYLLFAFVILAAYVSHSVQDSRLGRAWMAIREDESVAEAMGVNVVTAKLWAFVIGAVIASFGGALFAVKTGSVFPNSFDIIVSITVLAIVIVGGMGSIPGVVLAAVALRALPEVLQEFQSFRFLVYGALLIFMMLKRPEGFIPSRRRARELHEDEVVQDAWLVAQEREAPGADPA
jgi:branched-chain amino acid transport system permease protein